MAVIGIAILYATFYVWLGVDLPGSMKVTECMWIGSFLYFYVLNRNMDRWQIFVSAFRKEQH